MEYSKRYAQYWVTIAVSLATLSANMSMIWTTPVLPKFHNNETDIHLSDEEMSWLVSIMAPGLMVGCMAAQYPAHNLGRRFTIMMGALPFVIGTIFVLTATHAWMLCVARFCWGFSSGIYQTVVMIYVVEIASKDIRGKLIACNRYIATFGGLVILVTGSFISYKALSWFLIVVPVCYFIACWFIPETPYFLLKEGKVDAAREALMKLNGYKDKMILEEKLTEMRLNVKNDMQSSGSLRELLTGRKYRRAVVISVGLVTSRLLCGSIAMKQYIGRILQETTSFVSMTGGVIIFGALAFLCSVIASLLVDKVGRRPLLLYSYIASTIILIILGGCFFMDEVMNSTPGHFGYINLFANLLICVVSTLGYDTVVFIVPAEVFPLNVKSKAMTYLNLLGSVMTFASIRGYQVVKDFSGLYGVFWVFALFSLFGAVFTYVAVPETRGKSLEEIQQELQCNYYHDNGTQFPIINNKDVELDEIDIKRDAEELTALKS